MAEIANAYQPDYSVEPGAILAERLETYDMSYAEFARRCGRSTKLISEIIAGKAPVEPRTALQFEKVTGVAAHIWLGIQADYALYLAKKAEAEQAQESIAWARRFPVGELVKRGMMQKSSSPTARVSEILSFFGVGSVDAWNDKYGPEGVRYRHSPSFTSDEFSLATWLRLGQLQAEQQTCAAFEEPRFKQSLGKIRALTREPVGEALHKAREYCNQSGVVLTVIRPLPKTAISGAAWWVSRKKAVIALSARHKTDDHLWFTLFHEAAHLLLHGKREVFIDSVANEAEGHEAEANRWASDFLIPSKGWKEFIATGQKSVLAIRRFAEEQGIAPGIVVGRLQHERYLPWRSRMNKLKVRLQWAKTSEDS